MKQGNCQDCGWRVNSYIDDGVEYAITHRKPYSAGIVLDTKVLCSGSNRQTKEALHREKSEKKEQKPPQCSMHWGLNLWVCCRNSAFWAKMVFGNRPFISMVSGTHDFWLLSVRRGKVLLTEGRHWKGITFAILFDSHCDVSKDISRSAPDNIVSNL